MSNLGSIYFRGFEFDFEYNYSAGTPATWEHPGDYEEWDIYNITLNGIDASDLLCRYIEDFEQEVINNLKEY